MPIFKKLFGAFQSEKPHAKFKELYARLSETAALLGLQAKTLREKQKNLLELKEKNLEPDERTGGIAFRKTESIEEVLIPQLKLLVSTTSQRYRIVEETTAQEQPISEFEKKQIDEVVKFLEEIQTFLERTSDPNASVNYQLNIVQDRLREIDKLCSEFYDEQKRAEAIVQTVRMGQISPLLRRIFNEAKPEKPHPGEGPMLTVTITKGQLSDLAEEAKRINDCFDDNWKVQWRQWWLDDPKIEKDHINPKEHVNVEITFRGANKKIHLYVAA